MIKAIAESGGVCSINMVGGFVDTTNPDIVTTDTLFRHIDYMARFIGIDRVGFASDYIPDVTWTAGLDPAPWAESCSPTAAAPPRWAPRASPPAPVPDHRRAPRHHARTPATPRRKLHKLDQQQRLPSLQQVWK